MKLPLAELLQHFIDRVALPVSRVSSQAAIPKQTLFNWLAGRTPRWHPTLPADLARLSVALGLDPKESDALLMAAGCVCAVDTPYLEETTMKDLKLPLGWFRAGSHPKHYVMGRDPKVQCNEAPTALLRSRKDSAEGFGTLMQSCSPGDFRGKRVRLSAEARTEGIEDWAGLWFRIDGPDEGKSLRFDNMQNRSLSGTRAWERHAVVLDVPEEAVRLAYGILLSGKGKVWVADVRIEEVDRSVPSTDMKVEDRVISKKPTNLDFRE